MEWIKQNLVTPSEYATQKKTNRGSVYAAIKSGRIIPTYIGTGKHVFIEYEKFKDVEFSNKRGRRAEIIN